MDSSDDVVLLDTEHTVADVFPRRDGEDVAALDPAPWVYSEPVQESADAVMESADAVMESTDTVAESTDPVTESMVAATDSADPASESTDTTPGPPDTTPGPTDTTPQSTDTIPGSTYTTPESTGTTSESTDVTTPESMDPAPESAAQQEEPKKIDRVVSATDVSPITTNTDVEGRGRVTVDDAETGEGASRARKGLYKDGVGGGEERGEEDEVPCMLMLDSTKGHRSQEVFRVCASK